MEKIGVNMLGESLCIYMYMCVRVYILYGQSGCAWPACIPDDII